MGGPLKAIAMQVPAAGCSFPECEQLQAHTLAINAFPSQWTWTARVSLRAQMHLSSFSLLLPGVMVTTRKESREATIYPGRWTQLCRLKPPEDPRVLDVKHHSGLIRISLKLGTAQASVVPAAEG